MKIQTISKTKFILQQAITQPAATLEYTDTDFKGAELFTDESYLIRQTGTGIWHTLLHSKKMAKTSVEAGARIILQLISGRKQYRFTKSGSRFKYCMVQICRQITLIGHFRSG